MNNEWYYRNIYNNYFCFCKGPLCLYKSTKQKYQRCKYYFYLYIVFNCRNLYKKTDYLLADNLYSYVKLSEDYSYFVFLEMIKQNLPAHYMTINNDLYNNYSINNMEMINSTKIIKSNFINGDFLENYLELILKLKVVLTAFEYLSFDNLFFNIEYITYIYLGHGIHYFKRYLFNDYHSCEKYNKILIAPSNILVSIAKNYGWYDENIVKIGFPRWDRFSEYQTNNKNISIFLMFTWRKMRYGKNISQYYLNNTINLLSNRKLNNLLTKRNITLFYTFHHELKKYINLKYFEILKNYKNIKRINQSQIFENIAKSSLLISDFSSISFDFIYQKKPVVLFVPDSDDPNIKDIYIEEYYDIINGLKNDSIDFENKFFTLKKAINKIIYYIKNNFTVDLKLKKFYNSFHLDCKNNTKSLIEYIKALD